MVAERLCVPGPFDPPSRGEVDGALKGLFESEKVFDGEAAILQPKGRKAYVQEEERSAPKVVEAPVKLLTGRGFLVEEKTGVREFFLYADVLCGDVKVLNETVELKEKLREWHLRSSPERIRALTAAKAA